MTKTEINAIMPEQLPYENKSQYGLFKAYISEPSPRKIAPMAEEFGKSERIIYAYAKKFNWLARAKEFDKKYHKMSLNFEKLRKEEIKLHKIKTLNDSQIQANEIMDHINNKNHFGYNTSIVSIICQQEDISSRLNNYNKILRAIECYTRICINIDLQLDKILSDADDDNLTEQSLLDLEEHYKNELEILEKYASEIETDSIYEELQMIEDITEGSEDYKIPKPKEEEKAPIKI